MTPRAKAQKFFSKNRKLLINNYFLLCHSSTKTRRGEAKKIEEYVPKNIPAVNIKAKYFVDSGPKKKRDNKTIITVSEVKIDRIYD